MRSLTIGEHCKVISERWPNNYANTTAISRKSSYVKRN